MTKCTFQKYGASGTVTKHDGLCILALNIINEKVYVFLWFWFVGVAIMSTLAIIYRAIILMVPSLRFDICYNMGFHNILLPGFLSSVLRASTESIETRFKISSPARQGGWTRCTFVLFHDLLIEHLNLNFFWRF